MQKGGKKIVKCSPTVRHHVLLQRPPCGVWQQESDEASADEQGSHREDGNGAVDVEGEAEDDVAEDGAEPGGN